MLKLSSLSLSGKLGHKYDFNVLPINSNFNKVGAVYAITKRVKNSLGGGTHEIYYIGKTNDLSTRFDDHHKLDRCIKQGANCICIHQESQESSRVIKEVDLISKLKPMFNELLK